MLSAKCNWYIRENFETRKKSMILMATQRNGLPPSLALHSALEQAELEKCWILCPGCSLALSAPPCDAPTWSPGTFLLILQVSYPFWGLTRCLQAEHVGCLSLQHLAEPRCSAQPSICPLPCMHCSIIHSPLGFVAAYVSFTRWSTSRQALFLLVCISTVYISE